MDVSNDIRSMLRAVAKEFAAAEGVVAGHVHFLAALNHLGATIRQEFDRVVTHGLFDEQDDVEEPAVQTDDVIQSEPPVVEAQATETPEPAAADDQVSEPAPEPMAEQPTEGEPA